MKVLLCHFYEMPKSEKIITKQLNISKIFNEKSLHMCEVRINNI